jgi:diguanylate cyclase (GGDEF)-like protein
VDDGDAATGADHVDTVTIAIYALSVVLAAASAVLFLVAIRRLVSRQTEVVATMLERYDGRLAEFAQTLNDALTAPHSGAVGGAAYQNGLGGGPDDHGTVLRTLELARDRTEAHAAIAIVTGASGTPTFATVGLSQAEAAHVGRMGFPDYRGARAIQVSFNGEAEAPPGSDPVRSGLVVQLLAEPTPPSLLAVLTRARDRSFSESDILALEQVVAGARPALERSLTVREPDLVPELDPLTQLYDRQAFHALLDREIHRARTQGRPLALLTVDVDRLTTLNARIGHLAADGALAEVAERLRGVAGRQDYPCRTGGGRYAVLLPGGEARDAEALFERLRLALADRPIRDVGLVSVTAGVATLLPSDDVAALVARADAALGIAKGAGRGTVVSTAAR